MQVYLVSTKNPALKYRVVKYDESTKTATLQGQYAPFEIRPFTKARVAEQGYTLVKE